MMVPIQVASQRSGLSAHVIRIWERRYAALEPSRTGTNRRMYEDQDIQRLKILKELTERGHRIGGIAQLTTEELARLLQDDRSSTDRTFQVDATPALESTEQYVEASLSAIRAFEGERLRRLLHRSRLQFGQRGMLRRVIAPLIVRLGTEWQEGTLRTAQEHLGTAIIKEVLLAPVPGSQTASTSPEIVMATPSGEVHEIGAMLATASARDLGWRVTYLGPNLPAEEIATCARARKARAVALSIVYPENSTEVLHQVRELRKILPKDIALIIGGRAIVGYRSQLEGLAIHWVQDLPELDHLLVSLDHLLPLQSQSTSA